MADELTLEELRARIQAAGLTIPTIAWAWCASC
jgi:hypothetical protein